jgi:ABC-type transporter Mla MlaB component
MPATDDGLTLALSGPVTFAHTARLARELRPRAAAARVLDWSAVTQVDSSAVATSCGVAAKVAGISSGWLAMRAPLSTWDLRRSYTMRSWAACMSTTTMPWAFSARM